MLSRMWAQIVRRLTNSPSTTDTHRRIETPEDLKNDLDEKHSTTSVADHKTFDKRSKNLHQILLEGRLTDEERINYALQATLQLSQLHHGELLADGKKSIHGDPQPKNFILSNGQLKLLNLDSAIKAGTNRFGAVKTKNANQGNSEFRAPETQRKILSYKTDSFSLGKTLKQLLPAKHHLSHLGDLMSAPEGCGIHVISNNEKKYLDSNLKYRGTYIYNKDTDTLIFMNSSGVTQSIGLFYYGKKAGLLDRTSPLGYTYLNIAEFKRLEKRMSKHPYVPSGQRLNLEYAKIILLCETYKKSDEVLKRMLRDHKCSIEKAKVITALVLASKEDNLAIEELVTRVLKNDQLTKALVASCDYLLRSTPRCSNSGIKATHQYIKTVSRLIHDDLIKKETLNYLQGSGSYHSRSTTNAVDSRLSFFYSHNVAGIKTQTCHSGNDKTFTALTRGERATVLSKVKRLTS